MGYMFLWHPILTTDHQTTSWSLERLTLNDTVYRMSQKALHTGGLAEASSDFCATRYMYRSTKMALSRYSVSVACDHFEQNLQVATPLCLCCFVRSQMHLRPCSPSCAVGTSGDLPTSLYLCIGSNITFFRAVNQIVPGVFISKIKPSSLRLNIWKLFVCQVIFCCAAIVYKNPFISISNEIAQSDWSYYNW
jgi:hypothetical protein